jgi:deoxyadenosine/deoxycytidine kinase
MWCIGEHLNIFYNKLQKNSFACKIFFWEKRFAVLFQNNSFGS